MGQLELAPSSYRSVSDISTERGRKGGILFSKQDKYTMDPRELKPIEAILSVYH